MVVGRWRGPAWQVFDSDPGQCSLARAWIKSVVAQHGCPADPDHLAVVVSELFTNAVQHGPVGGRVLVGYCLWSRGARIVVADGGGDTDPRLVDAARLAEGGRGLHVVATLAARWGNFRLPGAQVVWSDLGQPLRVPAADAWAWLYPVLSECSLSGPARQQAAVLAAAGAR